MSVRIRNVRFGFGFYLGLSACIHAVVLLFVSFAPAERPKQEAQEVVPAKVSFREPVRRSMAGGATAEYMSMDADLAENDHQTRAVRQATGLPRHMRRAPRPDAYEKDRTVKYAQLPDPSKLSAEIKPPSTDQLPDSIQEIEVTLGEMEAIERIPTVGTQSDQSSEELMSLGEEETESSPRRRLLKRPSFPYSRVRPHLPDNRTTVVFEVKIDSSGEVEKTSISQGSGNKQLNTILQSWVNQWTYQQGTSTVNQSVTVQIPGS